MKWHCHLVPVEQDMEFGPDTRQQLELNFHGNERGSGERTESLSCVRLQNRNRVFIKLLIRNYGAE